MNRDSGPAQALVGNFGNTLVLRLDTSGDPSFAELLRRTHEVATGGFGHQDMPYDEVVAALRERGAGGADAFNVMLLFLTQGLDGPRLPGVATSWRNVHNGTHQFDLSLEAFLVGGELEIEATFSAALFSAARIDELLAELTTLLDTVAADPDTRLSALAVRDWPVTAPARAGVLGARDGAGDGAVEQRIRTLMAELLECDGVAANQDFFALGGNSLLATKLVAQVRSALGADISVRTVAEFRTPEALAWAVSSSRQSAGWRAVSPAEGEQRRPLSVAQHALWFLYQASGPTSDYNVAFARRLTGRLDAPALRDALVDLLDRHEVLRATVTETGAVPEHSVMDTADAVDAGAGPRVRRAGAAGLDGALEEELRYSFQLDREPAFRPILFELNGGEGEDGGAGDGTEHVLLLLLDHMVADEWSETVLFDDLRVAYRARHAGGTPKFAPLPVSYADYARWQRAALDGPELDRQRQFWRAQLRDLPEEVPLPTDRPRRHEPSATGDAVTIPLPRPVLAALRGLAVRAGTTPFVVWHALVALLLSRNGAGSDIPVGTPVSGRGSVSLHGVVGMFVNSVVLRADLTGNPTFAELVARVAEADLAAFDGADLPFERVVDLVDPPRVLGRTPLFQTMVVYADQNPPALRLPEVVDTPLSARLEAAKFDLSFTLVDDETSAPSATVRYSTALFDRSTAHRLADELRQLAEQVAADPNRPLARIEHLTPAEHTRIVRTWNATEAPVSDSTLPEMFAAQVAATPDAVATACGEAELTYRELDQWAGQLAVELLSLGVGPERTVGIHLERSLEMVVALLAVQRAGGAFVPLEPSWPRPRIQDTLATSRPVLVLSHDPGSLAWADVPARGVPAPDRDAAEVPVPRLDPENLAYVMYTSGSTGQPKGAMIRQRAIANRLLWQIGLLDFGPGDAALFKAPLGFDISINEVFLPLVSGARLVICEPGLEREVDELAGLIARQRVTFTYLPASMLELLLGTVPGQLACLRHVWCGGELLNPELYARFRAQVGATPYHGYGPAEATIGVSHEVYRPGHHRRGTTIGTANPNTMIYLLDAQLCAVSTGVPGEIYLGGLPLARGYVGEPTRTAERFVADPFGGPGSRLYRTGDLARWRDDGVLEFLGRADNQIKIRGMRVELEEIESALARHPGVRQAAVRLHDGPAKRLVGYQVPDPAAAVDADALRRWLAGQLPAHMVPDTFLTLAALPTLPSGKIDRAALPVPDAARSRSRAPRGEAETRLAELFARVLGVTGNGGVGAEDDFFTLGGDSILSIQLVSTARAEGLRFTVRDVFSAPTVAGLADRVSRASLPAPTPAQLADPGGALPLSPLQRGLVFHSLADETEADAYIAQLALTFTGQLDADALRAALAAVLGRHESLRTAFHHDGLVEPVQTIAPRVDLPWRELDIAGHAEREERWTELRRTERATRFALDWAPLLRTTLVRVAEGEHRLLLTNHHLLFDGWCLPLLVADLLRAYPGGQLPPAEGQYSAYLAWLAERDTVEADRAWRAALDGVTGPTLFAGAEDSTAYQPSEELQLQLGPELTARLTQVAREHRVTLNTVLMAGWGTLLGLLTGEPDVLFGITVSGRPAELPAAAETVGLFINTVPARVAASAAETFGELLRRLHANQVDLLDHQHLGLADIQRAVGLGELFDTLLVFESYPVQRGELDAAAARAGLRLTGIEAHDDTHYPLTALVLPGEDLRITLKFRPAVLAAEQVRNLGERLRGLLRGMAEDPGRLLARLEPLLPGETSSWAVKASGPAGDVDTSIAAAASRWPDRAALRFEDQRLSYVELDARVNQLAWALLERGAGPERIVGVAARRGVELVVALLATLRAGAAYVPLDPDLPASRLRGMLTEADPVVLLTTADVAPTLPALVSPPLLLDDPALADRPTHAPEVAIDPAHPAYVIYTSGSTGAPKGAVLTRAGLYNRLSWMAAHYGIKEHDVLAQKTPAGFDVSVWEFFLPFMVGAQLVVARPDGHRDPRYLAELIQSTGVTTVHFVPSRLRAFLAEPSAVQTIEGCRSLRRVLHRADEHGQPMAPGRARGVLRGARRRADAGPLA